MKITEAQQATLNYLRANRPEGHYEIAPTKLVGTSLHVFFNDCRVAILGVYPYDGSHMAQPYGTRRIGRFGTVTVKRPVDLLTD